MTECRYVNCNRQKSVKNPSRLCDGHRALWKSGKSWDCNSNVHYDKFCQGVFPDTRLCDILNCEDPSHLGCFCEKHSDEWKREFIRSDAKLFIKDFIDSKNNEDEEYNNRHVFNSNGSSAQIENGKLRIYKGFIEDMAEFDLDEFSDWLFQERLNGH